MARRKLPSTPPVDYIERTQATYDALGYPPYQWAENPGTPPFTPLSKPLREARLALIGSGGIYRTGQIAFHHRDDDSLRIIDSDTPVDALRATHFAYDLSAARADPNVVFPLEHLRAFERSQVIGELSPRAFAFMGGIYSARRVKEHLAPALTDALIEDEVDVALLVPV